MTNPIVRRSLLLGALAIVHLSCTRAEPSAPDVRRSNIRQGAPDGAETVSAASSGGTTGENGGGTGEAWEDCGGRGGSPIHKEGQGVDRHGVALPVECVEALAIVDYLAERNSYGGFFDPRKCGALEGGRIADAIGRAGLRITNVNNGADVTLPAAEVVRQATFREGSAFRALAHLGSIYALPLQYSKATCLVSGESLTIELSHWYRLKYQRESGCYRLVEVNYIEHEDQ